MYNRNSINTEENKFNTNAKNSNLQNLHGNGNGNGKVYHPGYQINHQEQSSSLDKFQASSRKIEPVIRAEIQGNSEPQFNKSFTQYNQGGYNNPQSNGSYYKQKPSFFFPGHYSYNSNSYQEPVNNQKPSFYVPQGFSQGQKCQPPPPEQAYPAKTHEVPRGRINNNSFGVRPELPGPFHQNRPVMSVSHSFPKNCSNEARIPRSFQYNPTGNQAKRFEKEEFSQSRNQIYNTQAQSPSYRGREPNGKYSQGVIGQKAHPNSVYYNHSNRDDTGFRDHNSYASKVSVPTEPKRPSREYVQPEGRTYNSYSRETSRSRNSSNTNTDYNSSQKNLNQNYRQSSDFYELPVRPKKDHILPPQHKRSLDDRPSSVLDDSRDCYEQETPNFSYEDLIKDHISSVEKFSGDYESCRANLKFNKPLSKDFSATLWMGDLESQMDQQFLYNLWHRLGFAISIKMPPQKNTRVDYSLVTFENSRVAKRALETYQGTAIPGSLEEKKFKLRWAFDSEPSDGRANKNKSMLFVGDLDCETTEEDLRRFFQKRYPSTDLARVVYDLSSGRSKQYGFVRIPDPEELERASHEMPGALMGRRPLVVKPAEFKSKNSAPSEKKPERLLPKTSLSLDNYDFTTLLLDNIHSNMQGADLRAMFGVYGEIVQIKRVLSNSKQALVQFRTRSQAAGALAKLNLFKYDNQVIRVSWFNKEVPTNSSSNDHGAAISVSDQNQCFLKNLTRLSRNTHFHPYRKRLITLGSAFY